MNNIFILQQNDKICYYYLKYLIWYYIYKVLQNNMQIFVILMIIVKVFKIKCIKKKNCTLGIFLTFSNKNLLGTLY